MLVSKMATSGTQTSGSDTGTKPEGWFGDGFRDESTSQVEEREGWNGCKGTSQEPGTWLMCTGSRTYKASIPPRNHFVMLDTTWEIDLSHPLHHGPNQGTIHSSSWVSLLVLVTTLKISILVLVLYTNMNVTMLLRREVHSVGPVRLARSHRRIRSPCRFMKQDVRWLSWKDGQNLKLESECALFLMPRSGETRRFL